MCMVCKNSIAPDAEGPRDVYVEGLVLLTENQLDGISELCHEVLTRRDSVPYIGLIAFSVIPDSRVPGSMRRNRN